MTRGQERLGRSLARAIRGIEFDAKLTDRLPEGDLVESEQCKAPRVEVRHPTVETGGFLWLVAIITLEPKPEVTYAVPAYRSAIERAVRRVLLAEGIA